MPAAQIVVRVQPRVVLVRMKQRFPDEAWEAVERRTRMELSALGLEVVSVEARVKGTDARLAELRDLSRARRAVGALRISRRGGKQRVQLWVYDALTRKSVMHDTTVPLEGGGDASAVVAFRLVGLLHASLLELRMRGPGRIRPKNVPRVVQRMVERRLSDPRPTPRAGDLELWGGPAFSLVHLGSAPSATLQVGGGWRALSWLVMGLSTTLPLSSAEIDPEDPRGKVRLLGFAAQAWARVDPWAARAVSPALDVGLGALMVRARGEATPPHTAMTDWSTSTRLSARLRLGLRLGSGTRLVPFVGAGILLPSIPIYFDDDPLRKVGWLVLEGGLLVQWSSAHGR